MLVMQNSVTVELDVVEAPDYFGNRDFLGTREAVFAPHALPGKQFCELIVERAMPFLLVRCIQIVQGLTHLIDVPGSRYGGGYGL
jgi:hypothetical protein